MIEQLQVSYVSIKSFHLPYEMSPAELASGSEEFRDAGITVLSGGNINLKDPATLRQMFEYAKASGLPMMVCAPSHETIDQVEELVKEFNIKIAIHNHGPEDRHFPSPESALEVVANRDRRMGLCIDVGHTTRTGTNVVESIRQAGPRLFDLHVKDLRDLMESRSQCDVGEGAMPVASIFQELKRMNYQGGVMLEYEINADDPLMGMAKSLAYMRGVLDGLAG
jgi:sugar phosphate isomerase/epimerase